MRLFTKTGLFLVTIYFYMGCEPRLCGCTPPPSSLYALSANEWTWLESNRPFGYSTPASTGETRTLNFFTVNLSPVTPINGDYMTRRVNGKLQQSLRQSSPAVQDAVAQTLLLTFQNGSYMKLHFLPVANGQRIIECTDLIATPPSASTPYMHKYLADGPPNTER